MGTMAKIVVVFTFVLAVATVGFAQKPALNAEQQLRIERLNLINENATLKKQNLELQQQLTALQVQVEKDRIKASVEEGNPGFTWDPTTGVFTEKKQ